MSGGKGHLTALARLERQRSRDAYVAELKSQVQEHNALKGRARWETNNAHRSTIKAVRPDRPWPDSSDMPRAVHHNAEAWENGKSMIFGQDGIARRKKILDVHQPASEHAAVDMLGVAQTRSPQRGSPPLGQAPFPDPAGNDDCSCRCSREESPMEQDEPDVSHSTRASHFVEAHDNPGQDDDAGALLAAWHRASLSLPPQDEPCTR